MSRWDWSEVFAREAASGIKEKRKTVPRTPLLLPELHMEAVADKEISSGPSAVCSHLAGSSPSATCLHSATQTEH